MNMSEEERKLLFLPNNHLCWWTFSAGFSDEYIYTQLLCLSVTICDITCTATVNRCALVLGICVVLCT